MQLESHFPDRDAYIQYLRVQFPTAAARSPEVSLTRGGRAAAETRLQRIGVERYASSRNMLNGAVTHLSPYLRHGVLPLAEVRHYLLQQSKGQQTHKLLQELAWRDYYQRVYARLGQDIWSDIEPYKTGIARYADDLPSDVEQGTTGLACIDAFAHDLHTTGYLHNHARMWTAAYLIHHRRVRWQAGARWFLQHLLDGDPASNNLS
ncbi:MAG TPA: FAD-binding domain-containing protein, partial [Ktedonobacteraceae bacterium]|nr:FAD-binding domain-containing protein [Ktedonobacteraceae bacterium]